MTNHETTQVVAAAHTPSSAGCEPSHAGVLSRTRISTNTSAPCVLGLLGSRAAKQDRMYARDHSEERRDRT